MRKRKKKKKLIEQINIFSCRRKSRRIEWYSRFAEVRGANLSLPPPFSKKFEMDRSRGSVAVINHQRPCIDRAALNTCECFGDNMSTRNWRGGGRGGRNNGDFARRAWKIQTREDRSIFHRETLSFNGQALPL